MNYWEDIEIGLTIDLGTHYCEPGEVIAYAREFDPQFFHLDEARAKQTMFGGLIASGWYTASSMSRMMGDRMATRFRVATSPGFDDLRWHKPVYPGDTLSGTITFTEKKPSSKRPEIGSAKFRGEMLNQKRELVMSVVHIALFWRHPAAS